MMMQVQVTVFFIFLHVTCSENRIPYNVIHVIQHIIHSQRIRIFLIIY